MNILDKEDKSTISPFGGTRGPLPKRTSFSWTSPSTKGNFLLIPKGDLNIDGSYQRDAVGDQKIRDIARKWDWKLFGALSVIKREDGSYWVYDGGHRTRASFYRDDVKTLPCMVFSCEKIEEEAKAFVGANTMQSAVSAYSKYRASLRANEPLAISMQAIFEKHGYAPSQNAKGDHSFNAIGTMLKIVRVDVEMAERAFAVCAAIDEDGSEKIKGDALEGIWLCARKLKDQEDILIGKHFKKLKAAGLAGINALISRETHIIGRGGASTAAKAILDLLNKGKRNRLYFDQS